MDGIGADAPIELEIEVSWCGGEQGSNRSRKLKQKQEGV